MLLEKLDGVGIGDIKMIELASGAASAGEASCRYMNIQLGIQVGFRKCVPCGLITEIDISDQLNANNARYFNRH